MHCRENGKGDVLTAGTGTEERDSGKARGGTYEAAPWGYTLLVFIVYLFVPYGITAYISKFKKSEEANDEFNTITIGK